jgi:hemolysin III
MGSVKVKPKLRGVFHQFGFIAALGGLFVLALAPTTGWQYVAGLIYGVCLCVTLGTSTLYHRPTWSPRARQVMRRVDHAAIFALIAGTFTPVAMLHAHGRWDFWLTLMWGAAVAGAAFVILFTHAHRALRAAVYVGIGLIAAPVLFSLPELIGTARVATLALGAAIYIAGAAVYARRWFNFRPQVFGYHEAFHVMVLIAAAAHYAVVVNLQFR